MPHRTVWILPLGSHVPQELHRVPPRPPSCLLTDCAPQCQLPSLGAVGCSNYSLWSVLCQAQPLTPLSSASLGRRLARVLQRSTRAAANCCGAGGPRGAGAATSEPRRREKVHRQVWEAAPLPLPQEAWQQPAPSCSAWTWPLQAPGLLADGALEGKSSAGSGDSG